MDAFDEPDRAWSEVLSRAFTLAAEYGDDCRPVHILAALSELAGPIGAALSPPDGSRLWPRPADPLPARGGSCGYLAYQTQDLCHEIAMELSQTPGPGHLFLAVLDQGEPEAMAQLESARLEVAELRAVALAVLRAPSDLPPIAPPPLTPAGTHDRPPLPVDQLDDRVWRVLCWRQEHLPLNRLHREADWFALAALESRAAWKLADEAHVDDDQRYSIDSHHSTEVERRAHAAKPGPVVLRSSMGGPSGSGFMYRGPRRLRSRVVPNFMIGWPTWFGNRRVGLRNRRFRLLTWWAYHGQPRLSA